MRNKNLCMMAKDGINLKARTYKWHKCSISNALKLNQYENNFVVRLQIYCKSQNDNVIY